MWGENGSRGPMIFGSCSGPPGRASAAAAIIGRPAAVPVNPQASAPEIFKKLRRLIPAFDPARSVRGVMSALYRNRRFYRRMRIVFAQSKILETKIADLF